MSPRQLAIIVLIAAIAFAASPLLTIGFNGFTQGQFPVEIENPPVQPAGYAFSIWGLIYLWLIVGAAFGLWKAASDPDWQAMRTPLAASLFIGFFWLVAANAAPVLATVMIVAMAATAILAMLRAGVSDPVFQVHPVALYAGWLTAATGVAIGVMLGGYGILSAQMAAIICLIGVLGVAIVVQSVRPRAWTYPAAIIWALVGVIVSNAQTMNTAVIALCVFGIVALLIRPLGSLSKGVST